MGTSKALRTIIFLSIALATSQLAAKELSKPDEDLYRVPCTELSALLGVEKLSKFERMRGSYSVDRITLKWRDLTRSGWPGVVIPEYEYGPAKVLDPPFKGLRLADRSNDVDVTVNAVSSSQRTHLFKVANSSVFEAFKGRPLFSFLEEALGVYVDGFSCRTTDVGQSVAMFMSSEVLPIDSRKTRVYRLTNPKALLLVPTTGELKRLHLIFPNNSNIDALTYVRIWASESSLQAILRSIRPN
jgi:hypothetical protein